MPRTEYHAVQGAYVDKTDPPDPFIASLRASLPTYERPRVYEPCPWCASHGFGLPCPTHGADYQADRIGSPNAPTTEPEPLRPLVLLDITGGVETATYTYPGVGEPEVRIFDFDDETDDRGMLADDLYAMARAIRGRSTHPDDLYAAVRYELAAVDVLERIAEEEAAH